MSQSYLPLSKGLVENSNVSFTDLTSGILGLGFPRLSSFSTGKDNRKAFYLVLICFWKFTSPTGLPFFANLAAQGLLEYPLFAFSLTGNSSGTLTLGAVDGSVVKNPNLISWIQVAEFPPFGVESNESSYFEWAVPVTGFTVCFLHLGLYFCWFPVRSTILLSHQFQHIMQPNNLAWLSLICTFDSSGQTFSPFNFSSSGAPGIYGTYQDVSSIWHCLFSDSDPSGFAIIWGYRRRKISWSIPMGCSLRNYHPNILHFWVSKIVHVHLHRYWYWFSVLRISPSYPRTT